MLFVVSTMKQITFLLLFFILSVTAAESAKAIKLIASLDIPADRETRTYRFGHITPDRIDKIMLSRIEASEPKEAYSSTIDESAGMLIVIPCL